MSLLFVPPTASSMPSPPHPQAVDVSFLPKVLTWKECGCWPLLEESLRVGSLAGTGICPWRLTCWGKECSGKRVTFPGLRLTSLQEEGLVPTSFHHGIGSLLNTLHLGADSQRLRLLCSGL